MNTSLKNHWVTILVITLITFTASVVLTVVQPMEYRSAFTVLAIDQDANLDGYAAAKSAERLSQSLGTTIATTSFADQVYQQLKDRADLKDNPIISSDVQTRRNAWKKEVVVRVVPDVGQVKVSIYQRDPKQAETIANAVSIAITAFGTDYLGGGQNVALRIVDTPLTSTSPVRPNVFANLAVGLILGFGGSIAFILLFTGAAGTAVPMIYAPMMLPMTPLAESPEKSAQPIRVHRPTASVGHDHEPAKPVPVPEHVLHVPHVAPTHASIAAEKKSDSPANLPVIDEWVMP